MVNIITRGEARRIKDRERKAAKRKNSIFRKSENERLRNRVTKLRQNEEYVQASNLKQSNRRKQKKIESRAAMVNLTNNLEVPWFIQNMNLEFDKTVEQHG